MDHFLRPLDAADSTPHSARLTDSKLLDDIRLGRAPHGGIEVNNLKLRKFSKAFEDSKRFGQSRTFESSRPWTSWTTLRPIKSMHGMTIIGGKLNGKRSVRECEASHLSQIECTSRPALRIISPTACPELPGPRWAKAWFQFRRSLTRQSSPLCPPRRWRGRSQRESYAGREETRHKPPRLLRKASDQSPWEN